MVTAERGDVVIAPPGLDRAFAAAPGEDAEVLIVITPGQVLNPPPRNRRHAPGAALGEMGGRVGWFGVRMPG